MAAERKKKEAEERERVRAACNAIYTQTADKKVGDCPAWRSECLHFGLMKNSLSMRRNPCAILRVLKNVALVTKGYAGERDEAFTVIHWLKSIEI
jgi:hypothetical protein